jgi:hypothetical protein
MFHWNNGNDKKEEPLMINLLCNCKRTEHEKLYAYLAPMCALGNCQWYKEPYFAGTAISIDGFLPQIPR